MKMAHNTWVRDTALPWRRALSILLLALGSIAGFLPSLATAQSAPAPKQPPASAKEPESELLQKQQEILKSVSAELGPLCLGMSKEELLKLRPKAEVFGGFFSEPPAKDAPPKKDETFMEALSVNGGATPDSKEKPAATGKDEPEEVTASFSARYSGVAIYTFKDDKCVTIGVERQLDPKSAAAEQQAIVRECLRLFGNEYAYKVKVVRVPTLPDEMVFPSVVWKLGDEIVQLRVDPNGSAEQLPKRRPLIHVNLMQADKLEELKLSDYDAEKHKAWFTIFEKCLATKE